VLRLVSSSPLDAPQYWTYTAMQHPSGCFSKSSFGGYLPEHTAPAFLFVMFLATDFMEKMAVIGNSATD
jgi:hypothetical protein